MILKPKFCAFVCGLFFIIPSPFSASTEEPVGPIGDAVDRGIDIQEYLDNLGDPDFRPSVPSNGGGSGGHRGNRDKNLGAGVLVTTIGTGDEAARALVVQTDGKILAAGRFDNGTNFDFVIVRYHADGELDTSFNTRGKTVASFGGGADVAHGITIDTSGRAIVVGSTDSGGAATAIDFAVMRLNSDGTLDTSFKTAGFVATSIHTGAEFARTAIVQTDGMIVVGGYARSTHYNMAVVRYLSNGVLDTSFNSSGIVSFSIGTIDSGVNSIKVQTDGKLALAGTYWNGTDWDFAIARLNTDGSLDTSFNSSGKTTTTVGTGDDIGYSLGITTDAKWVVGGTAYNGTKFKFAVARYLTDGVLDTSFNSAGKVTAAIGTGDERIFGVGVQLDGGVLGAGVSSNGTNNDFAVARYRSNGTLDTSFNSGGYLRHAIGTGEEVAQAISMIGDQTIYVAGRSHNGTNLDFAVTRYHTDGTSASAGQLDRGLTTMGKLTGSVGTGTDVFYAAAQKGDGKLVSVGYLSRIGSADIGFGIARFNLDGTLDTSFMSSGVIVSTFGATGTGHVAYGVAMQTDGMAVAVGISGTAPVKFALMRYKTDGGFDTSFFTSGVMIASLAGGGNNSGAYGVVLATNGKVLLGGFASNGSNNDFAVARFNTDGSFDTSFNTSGRQVHTIGTAGEEIFGLVLQSDGKLVAVGFAVDASTHRNLAISRYTTDGRLDTSFSTAGYTTVTPVSGTADETYYGVAMDGNQIIAVGTGNDNQLAIARYNTNGTLDTSFETKGVIYKLNSGKTAGRGVKVQTNSKYVAGGYDGNTQEFIVLRYTTQGVLDTSFNTSGIVVASINGNANYGYGLILQNDGKIVVPGTYSNGSDDYAIMRFWP